MSAQSRDVSLDVLKVILACMVVGLHGGFLTDFSFVASFALHSGYFRVAVPIFFIIGGYFFFKMKDRQIWNWSVRLLSLYAIWSLLYSPLWLFDDDQGHEDILENIFFGYYHLWYLFSFLQAGLMIHAVRRYRPKHLFLISASLFTIGTVIEYIGYYDVFIESPADDWLSWTPMFRNSLVFGLPFMLLGFVIAQIENKITVSSFHLTFATAGAAGMLLVETALNFILSHHFAVWGPHDLFFSLFPLCPLIFLSARRFCVLGRTKTLGQVSLCIYLVHVFMLKLVQSADMLGQSATVVLAIILSVLVSPSMIWLNRRIPIL